MKEKKEGCPYCYDTIFEMTAAGRFFHLSQLENFDYIINVEQQHAALLRDTVHSFLGFEETDFNNDNHLDLLVVGSGGNNAHYTLYLWDSFNNKFVEVEGYSCYPESKALTLDSQLYYSTEYAGCSDLNIRSSLFRLSNNKIIPIATLYAWNCAYDDNFTGPYAEIRSSRWPCDYENLVIDSCAIDTTKSVFDFIENYWTNYKVEN